MRTATLGWRNLKAEWRISSTVKMKALNKAWSPCVDNIQIGVSYASPMSWPRETTGSQWQVPTRYGASCRWPTYGRRNPRRGEKKSRSVPNRTAEQPGQTLNVDLCFVPVQHDLQIKLPAVSGSSGRLIVERPKPEIDQQHWPGQIFANAEVSYEEAMQAYVTATQDRLCHPRTEKVVKGGRKSEKQALWRADRALREERYRVRERRKEEDAVWRAFRRQFIVEKETFRALPKAERRKQRKAREVHEQLWQTAWDQRRGSVEVRPREDAEWQARRRQLRESAVETFTVPAWFAILVMTDNCTRQCIGLPLFVAGPKVTADMVVQALAALLPPELQYLISDQGIHFRTTALAQLAKRLDFIWVPVARHRAQSNGIAERFVRTLKEWLADQEWQSSEELALLLGEFLPEYNARPHQGLPIPGLLPDEFAKRLWLM